MSGVRTVTGARGEETKQVARTNEQVQRRWRWKEEKEKKVVRESNWRVGQDLCAYKKGRREQVMTTVFPLLSFHGISVNYSGGVWKDGDGGMFFFK